MRMKALALAAAMALAAATPSALAQNASARPTYGNVELEHGFTPDPREVTVAAGGAVDASKLGEGCSGFIANAPDFVLRYRAGDLPLIISAHSDADTTLAIRAPDNAWHCDDDSAGALNPMVRLDSPRSGRYRVWVGVFAQGAERPAATLRISELSAASANERPDMSLDPAYGVVNLASGFTPDPYTIGISAGGELDASNLGVAGCVGRIARAPDYRLNWTAGQSGLPLLIAVQSDADTTLVVNDPSGGWVCNDDAGGDKGVNPVVRFATPASGQYDIWVGTFAEGELQNSTLSISELESQTK